MRRRPAIRIPNPFILASGTPRAVFERLRILTPSSDELIDSVVFECASAVAGTVRLDDCDVPRALQNLTDGTQHFG